jgi:hypothetical protein
MPSWLKGPSLKFYIRRSLSYHILDKRIWPRGGLPELNSRREVPKTIFGLQWPRLPHNLDLTLVRLAWAFFLNWSEVSEGMA